VKLLSILFILASCSANPNQTIKELSASTDALVFQTKALTCLIENGNAPIAERRSRVFYNETDSQEEMELKLDGLIYQCLLKEYTKESK